MLKFYQKMQYAKSVNIIVCIPDLVITKYFGNNTIETIHCSWPMPKAVITVVRAPDDGCQHPKHVELPTEM